MVLSVITVRPLSFATACNDCNFLLAWGSAGSGNGQFSLPIGVAVDSSGNVYVTDGRNTNVQKFTSTGTYITQWGSAGSGNGQFIGPQGIAVDSSGNVYVADNGNYRVEKFTSTGTYIAEWGSLGTSPGQFSDPLGVAVDSSGNVYVTDGSNRNVQKFTSTGTYITQWGTFGTSNGQLIDPESVAVDSTGNVYVTDSTNNRVEKFTSTGTFITALGCTTPNSSSPACPSGSKDGQFNFPQGVGVDSSGNVYVSDSDNNRIEKFDSSGNYLTQWGSLGSFNGQFNNPDGVAVNSSGNVYVVDSGNSRVEKFGDITTTITTSLTSTTSITTTVTTTVTSTTVQAAPTSLQLVTDVDHNVTVTVMLSGSYNGLTGPISGRTVSVSTSWGGSGSCITMVDGRCRVTMNKPGKGTYSVTAKFAGNNYFSSSMITKSITVK